MSKHADAHPMSGNVVKITAGAFAGSDYRVEDWWDRMAGQSWMDCDGNPACLEYAVRSASEGSPLDNDVVYGKIGAFGKLIHVSQFAAIPNDDRTVITSPS